MAKRLTEEELQHDPLIDFYTKIIGFYYAHKSEVIGGAIALIVIVGSIIAYTTYSSSQEDEAQSRLASAEQYFMQGDYQKALTGSETEFTVGFEQIINNYSRTDAANLATYYAAVSEYQLGNYEQALSYIQEFDYPEGILGVGPIAFHASLLSDMERYDEAAEKYIQAAEWDKNESTTPVNYLQAAEAFYQAGDLEQAEKYVDMVLKEYPNAITSGKPERLKGLLETKKAA